MTSETTEISRFTILKWKILELRPLHRIYCFFVGHDIPCGTCGLCQRCYGTVLGNYNKETGEYGFNKWMFSLPDIYYCLKYRR